MGGSSEVLLLVLGYVGHRQPTILLGNWVVLLHFV